MYEIRDLRIVLAIHENGSLARAARAMGIGQPVLTRQLAALEARVRGRLFERSARGAIATDLGRTVISQAGGILERLDDLNRSTADVRGEKVHELTIAAGAYMAESLCLAAASCMIATHPHIRIRLQSANWTEIPPMIHGREAAFGLLDMRSMRDDPALEVEMLHPHPGLFLVRPGHPLVGRSPITLAEILAFPMVFIGRVPTAVQAPMSEARRQAREAGTLHAAFPAMVQESPTVGLAALPMSDLVAAVTAPIAQRAVDAGQLAVLPWRAPWLSVHPGIVWLRQRQFAPAERDFLDLVREADGAMQAASASFCARFGLSADCGDTGGAADKGWVGSEQ